jgi:hypothetical protein
VTSARRSTPQRIENGFGDLPDGDGRCAGDRGHCGAAAGLDGAISPAGPIPDCVGPEKFAVFANFSEMWSILARMLGRQVEDWLPSPPCNDIHR